MIDDLDAEFETLEMEQDQDRRVSLAQMPLPAAAGMLAKRVRKAPKKRSTARRHRVEKAVSMTRKCVQSRAFKAAERQGKQLGLPLEEIKRMRQTAFQEAGRLWDVQNS